MHVSDAAKRRRAIGGAQTADMLNEFLDDEDAANFIAASEALDGADGTGTDGNGNPGSSSSSGSDDYPTAALQYQIFLRDRRIFEHNDGWIRKYSAGNETEPPFLRVYTNTTANGLQSLKAVCYWHQRCVCWVNKPLAGDQRFALLRDYVEWAASGSTKSDHDAAKALLRPKYHAK